MKINPILYYKYLCVSDNLYFLHFTLKPCKVQYYRIFTEFVTDNSF